MIQKTSAVAKMKMEAKRPSGRPKLRGKDTVTVSGGT